MVPLAMVYSPLLTVLIILNAVVNTLSSTLYGSLLNFLNIDHKDQEKYKRLE